MLQSCFRFDVVFADRAGSIVHREPVEDLQPVFEDMLFSAVCAGAVPNDGHLNAASIEPVWAEAGPPRVARITAELGPLSKTYGLAVVAECVRAAVLEHDEAIGEALTGEGESGLCWWLEGHRRDEPPARGASHRRLKVALGRAPIPLTSAPLSAFGLAGPLTDPHPMAIAIRRPVLEAIREETAESLDLERADILVGHVVRDPSGPVAVVVSDHIPAVRGTTASRTHFAFSSVTFEAARRAVAARTDGAVAVGWVHNHPPPCGGSCLQMVPPCGTDTLFLSAPADRAVHRACFSAPYMIALVSGKAAGQRASAPRVQAWSWRDAAIVARDFTVI